MSKWSFKWPFLLPGSPQRIYKKRKVFFFFFPFYETENGPCEQQTVMGAEELVLACTPQTTGKVTLA